MPDRKDIMKTIIGYLKKQKVGEIGFFGSFMRGESAPDSDIDVLVQYPRGTTLFDIVRMQQELEEKTGRSIDLVDKRAVLPRIMEEIQQDLEIVYRDEKQPDLS